MCESQIPDDEANPAITTGFGLGKYPRLWFNSS